MAKNTLTNPKASIRIATDITFKASGSDGINFDRASFGAWIHKNYWDRTNSVEVKRKVWFQFLANDSLARLLSQWYNKGDQLFIEIEPFITYVKNTDPNYPDEMVSWGPEVYQKNNADGSQTASASYSWKIAEVIERGADGQITAALKAAGNFDQGNVGAGSSGPAPFTPNAAPDVIVPF